MNDTKTEALSLYDRFQNPLEAINSLGDAMGKSGFFGVERIESGRIIALTCFLEKITPVQFMRTYDVIQGKLRKKAMAAYADFRKAGGRVKWIKTGDDGVEASAEFTFEGEAVTCSYTIAMAQNAKLVKTDSGWTKNPGNMLRARVMSNALGMLCPEIFAGIEDGDETQQPIAEIKLATPAPTTQATTVTVEPQKTETVIDAAAETKAEADAGLAPVQAAGTPNYPELPDDLLTKVQDILANDAVAALKYLRNPANFNGAEVWLKPDQSLHHLTPGRARMIIGKAEMFLTRIRAAK